MTRRLQAPHKQSVIPRDKEPSRCSMRRQFLIILHMSALVFSYTRIFRSTGDCKLPLSVCVWMDLHSHVKEMYYVSIILNL